MALKIAVILQPPRSSQCALDAKCQDRGFGVDYTRFVCQALKRNCTFVWYPNDYGDVSESGKATGLLGAIQRGEFDTSLPVYVNSYIRAKHMDFSDFYDINDIMLVTRAPNFDEGLNWSIVTAFQVQVWLSFALAVLFTASVINLILRRPDKSASGADSILELSRALVMNEFSETNSRFATIRIIAVAWLLSGFVLSSGYNGMLYADKVIFQYKLPYTDLDSFLECLDTKECNIVAASNFGTITQEKVVNLDNKANQTNGNRKKSSWVMVPNEAVPDRMLQEQEKYLVFVMPRNVMQDELLRNRKCKFYVIGIPQFSVYSFAFAKNSTLKPKIDKIVATSRDLGLVDALNRKYLDNSLCNEEWTNSRATSIQQDDGLMLYSMSTIFWFYILGVFVGLIALTLEAAAKRFASATEKVSKLFACAH